MEQTKALILMGSLGVFIVSVLFLIYFGGSIFSSGDSDLFSEKQVSSDADGTLTFWGVFDTSDDYLEAIEEFGKRYPEKVVEYTRFRNEVDYKRALLDAFAGGRGPDIFMIRNTDVAQYTDKAIPVASYILSISSLNNLFPDVVVDNFVRDGGVYALPLTIDTLALLYNKNHFNEATIVFPPITWEEIKGIVFDLVRYDNEGNIVGRRIALGGGNDTISNGTHILELMALQFNSMSGGEFRISSSDSSYALSFYSQFARPGGDYYSWDEKRDSYESFASEDSSVIFAYYKDIEEIKRKNGLLKIGVSSMPQSENAFLPVHYPNYWGYAVSRQSRSPALAWDFIMGMVNNPSIAEAYARKTNGIPALRVLIDKYKNDSDRGVFVRQALLARSWNKGDALLIDEALSRAVLNVQGGASPSGVLESVDREFNGIISRWKQ